MKTTLKLAAVIFTALCAAHAARAADAYVSHLTDGQGNPYYAGAPDGATVFADLRAAIADAPKTGQTIWVEDGYVYASGAEATARIYVTKPMTIRSRSGKWETGASIVADSSTRCIGVSKTGGGASLVCGNLKLIGFTLTTNGSDPEYGAVYVADGWARFDLENCRITGFKNKSAVYEISHAGKAGITHSTMKSCLYDGNDDIGKAGCVTGCDVYDSDFRYNRSFGNGSCYYTALADCIVSNCTFVCNTNGSANVGGAMCVEDKTGSFRCYDCNFVSNTFTRNITHGAHVRGYGRFERCNFLHGGWKQCSGAVKGYATRGLTLVDCVVSNNIAEASGGVCNVYATNTVIACNSAVGKAGGGGAFQSLLVDCDLIGNECEWGAGARECVLVDCRIKGNKSVIGGGAYGCYVTNCVVSGNTALSTSGTGSGAGLYVCTSAYCRVIGNRTTHNGGGVWGGVIDHSLIACNVATNNGADQAVQNGNATIGTGGGAYGAELAGCTVSNNVAWYRGAGVFGGTTKNCRIVDNQLIWKFTWIGAYGNGGSAVWGGTHWNDLIAGNVGYGKYGSAVSSWSTSPAWLYNCTVVGNTGDASAGGVDDSANAAKNSCFVNSVVALNTGTRVDSYLVASNSYMTVAGSAGADSGCAYGNDPKLETLDGVAYVPKMHSPCKDGALKFDWMTDPTDIRSNDLAGKVRLIGGAPDMGCYERNIPGFMLLIH